MKNKKYNIKLLLIKLIILFNINCDSGSEGCIDENACNYNELATLNDGSCIYPQENFDCENNCISHLDCSGKCGGSAIIDECLVCCSGDTGLLCNTNENCTECPSNEILGCDGVCNSNLTYDCIDICGGNAFIDDCSQCVGGQTGDSTYINLINVDEWAGNCHYYDNDTGQCKENWAMDCQGICFGESVYDACWTCVGGTTDIGDSWRISIQANVTMKSQTGFPIGSDSDSVVIGTSIHALDEWNIYSGECPDGSTGVCYSDAVYNPISNPSSNYIKFFFPHPEWEDQIPEFLNTTDIVQDIRYNDYSLLFSDGIVWNAELATEPMSNIIDSLSLNFNFIENVQECKIIIEINNEVFEIDQNQNSLELELNSDLTTYIKIVLSDICFIN